jgi:hypothetical protein
MSVSEAVGTFDVKRGKGTPLVTPSDLPPAEHFIDGEFCSGSRGQTAAVCMYSSTPWSRISWIVKAPGPPRSRSTQSRGIEPTSQASMANRPNHGKRHRRASLLLNTQLLNRTSLGPTRRHRRQQAGSVEHGLYLSTVEMLRLDSPDVRATEAPPTPRVRPRPASA